MSTKNKGKNDKIGLSHETHISTLVLRSGMNDAFDHNSRFDRSVTHCIQEIVGGIFIHACNELC